MRKLSSGLMDWYLGQLQREGIREVCWFNVQGQLLRSIPGVESLAGTLRAALQESIEAGGVHVRHAGAGLHWVFALEHERVVQGGLCSGVRVGSGLAEVRAEGAIAFDWFYTEMGWTPTLLQERRQDQLRWQQMAEAARQRDPTGGVAQERMLLAHIRAGDRTGARRLLNEVLATIYLSAPQTVVLRARVIEMLCSLTRAAVEDNPLLATLIEQNQGWTERMVYAASFEDLSALLLEALDAFFNAVHLHGSNRTNVHVHKALTYISEHFQDPIGLREVAQHTGLSSFRLSHLFRAHAGKTVVETIRQLRLQRAEVLLRQTGMTCSEVAYTVGFADQSYFSMHFKRHTGKTPGQFRRAQGI